MEPWSDSTTHALNHSNKDNTLTNIDPLCYNGSCTFGPATSSENQEASEGRAGRGRPLTPPSGHAPGTSPPVAAHQEQARPTGPQRLLDRR